MSIDEVSKRERTISGALALGMHLLFLILLVVGVSWQPKRSTAPIAVELWSELPPAPRKAEPPPEPEPAPPKQAPRPEPRPEPKPEAKPVPKPDIALKEQLIKKKQQEEKERVEREQKEREQKLAKEKLERERKLKEELEAKGRKEKELAEQKRREEEKKRLAEKQRQQEELAKAAREKEEALRKLLAQQAAEAEARGRLDAYSRRVADKIRQYIVEPPNVQGNPEAIFTVIQIPGGDIIDLKMKRSSGNPAYDAAVERAIRRAQPLPPPPDPARFSEVRELELRFRLKE